MKKYPRLLGSSYDPTQLSATIKGIAVGIVPVVLMLAPMFGWTVNPADFENFNNGLDGFLNAMQAAVVALTALYSAGNILFGILRKLAIATGLVKPKTQ